MNSLPSIGTRIGYSSNLGTVKYVGEVDGTKGIWLGVEWDDPKRGKHNGTKDGKQYFSCKIPNSGSFVRPGPSIKLGQSFLQALESKYVEAQSTALVEKVTLGSSNGAIQVEAPDMNKVRSKLSKTENLREVSLDKELVARVDEAGQLRLRKDIKGLDLSYNLLSSWDDVARIASELLKLETLSLNFCRLQMFYNAQNFSSAFNNLHELRLNGTSISWTDIVSLLPYFPELRQLELGMNNIDQLDTTPRASYCKLTFLNLEENLINSWSTTMTALAQFNLLERLVLAGNSISRIPPPSRPSESMPQMRYLTLASNDISTWSDIDFLAQWFPYLQMLNVNYTPVGKDHSSRPLIIAKIARLTTLNGSSISLRERNDSELFYLSYIAKNGPSLDESREREYGRYRELCEKHGKPVNSEQKLQDALKNRLLNVHVFPLTHGSPTKDTVETVPKAELKILPSMTLKVFRLKLLKALKLPPSTGVQLWLALERDSLINFAELDQEMANRPLEWWGVEDKGKVVYYVTS